MKNKDIGLLFLRLAVGILLLLHGVNKIFSGIEGIVTMLEEKGIPGIFAYAVYIGEVLAPIALVIGYRTRIAALLIVFNMLVIIFIAKPDSIPMLTENGAWKLELQGLYLFGSLALFFTGGGRLVVKGE